jgi:hypothetical protein
MRKIKRDRENFGKARFGPCTNTPFPPSTGTSSVDEPRGGKRKII